MKKHILLLVAIFVMNIVNAQWVQTLGPYGGRVSCITSCNSKIFAGGSGGVFVSSDNGTTWQAVNNGLPTGVFVNTFAVSGTTLYAGTNQGVYKSLDNGISWTDINTGLNYINVLSLAVSGTNIFAGTYYGGVYLSTNSGATWSLVNTGFKHTEITALAVLGNYIFAATWGGGIYMSSNNGTSWATVNSSLPSNTIIGAIVVTSLIVSGSNLYAALYQNGVYKSTNNGTSWTTVNTGNTGLSNLNVISLATDGTNIFAGTNGGGVFFTTSSGTSWAAVNTGLTSLNSNYVYGLAVIGGTVFAGTRDGIHLSTNTGTTWTTSNSGLSCLEFTSLVSCNSKIYASTDNGIFMSADTATTWIAKDSGLTTFNSQYILSLAATDTNLYAATYGGVYISKNYGTSWIANNGGLTSTDIYSVAAKGTQVYAASGDSIFLSTNSGTSWVAKNNGITLPPIFSLVMNGINVYAGTSNGVYLSTDNGTTWTISNNGLPINANVNSLLIKGDSIYAGTDQGVYVSYNNTSTWTAINNGITNTQIMTLSYSGTCLIAGTNGGGVYISTDFGTSWIAVNSGLPANTIVTASIVIANNLIIATTDGIWKRNLIEILTPYAAGQITGDTIVCKGTSNLVYSVPLIIGATSYIWSLPSGFTYTTNNDSIIVTVNMSAVSGNISVYGKNAIGVGNSSHIFVTVNPVINSAGAISGLIDVCGTMNDVTYTVPAITNATSYIWNVLNNTTDTTTTNSITTNISSSLTSGSVTVKGHNNCGNGNSSTLPLIIHQPYHTSFSASVCAGQMYVFGGINIMQAGVYSHTFSSIYECDSIVTLTLTVLTTPSASGTISGINGVCNGENNVIYTVPSIANATSYTWTPPYGATGFSTTNSIALNFSDTAIISYLQVYLQVYGVNQCGNGNHSVKSIVLTSSIPDSAKIITSTAAYQGHTVCLGDTNILYSTTVIPNATSYSWYYSGSGATISGNSNNVTISFSSSATSGDLIVYGHNGCGDGTFSPYFPINVINCTGAIAGYNEDNVYEIYPNPTTSEATISYPILKADVTLTFYNILGQIIHEGLLTKGSSQTKININKYQSGIYKVVLREKGEIKASLNLIKQ